MFYLRTKNTGQYLIVVILIVFLIAATSFLLQAAISCVDKDGCLKSYCKESWFDDDFQAIIDANKDRCSESREYSTS